MKIFKNQSKQDYAIVSQADLIKKDSKSKKIDPLKNKQIFATNDKIIVGSMEIVKEHLNLVGPHNIQNILFSLNIYSIFKKPSEKQINIIKNFSPPPHRLQKIEGNKIIINDCFIKNQI